MKALTLDIKPQDGLGALKFGMTTTQAIELIGKPDDEELLDYDELDDTLIYHYDEQDISLFFEGEGDKKILVNIETDNPDATMYGKKIFALTKDQIIVMMKEKGYEDIDTEVHEDDHEYPDENRVSFDEAMTDFFFEGDILTAVSWGEFTFDEEE